MSDAALPRPGVPAPTWFGLAVSLFGMLVLRWAFQHFAAHPDSTGMVLARELAHFALAAGLLVFVRVVERRPLSSVGIGTARPWKSLLWGLATFAACMLVAIVIIKLTHYNGGKAGQALDRLPVWLVTLIVVRAGVVEELCYRGYSMERLREVTGSRWIAVVLPLMIFGVGHWTGGWSNIVIALALGAVLAGAFVLRRDLVSNMFAHFLVDFASNVVPRLVH